jgi:hypothetical protein
VQRRVEGRVVLRDFALTQLENLDRFSNLHDIIRLNAISHRRSPSALVLCWRLAESDATVTPSLTLVA